MTEQQVIEKQECAVTDCKWEPIYEVMISINNEPKKLLPVCQMHFDAASEDSIKLDELQGIVNNQ